MIAQALEYICEQLNLSLSTNGLSGELAIVGPLVLPDGTTPPDNNNKIVLSLVSVEQVRDGQSFSNRTDPGANQLTVTRPIHLNLHVLVAASFTHYPTGLHYLSQSIAFLQAHMNFDNASPGMPKGIDRLALTMANIDYSQLSHLWSGIGAKYLPSALYLVRMITLDMSRIERELPAISEIETEGSLS